MSGQVALEDMRHLLLFLVPLAWLYYRAHSTLELTDTVCPRDSGGEPCKTKYLRVEKRTVVKISSLIAETTYLMEGVTIQIYSEEDILRTKALLFQNSTSLAIHFYADKGDPGLLLCDSVVRL